jgi:hypothetical protein
MPLLIKSRRVVADTSGKHPYDLPQADRASQADNALRVEIEPHITKLAPGATSDPNDTAIYVYLLEHIVGDLHQPLHCAALYNKSFTKPPDNVGTKANDQGGNLFKVSTSKSELNGFSVVLQSNLHSLWDHGGDNAIRTDSSLGITDIASLKPADLMSIAASWSASSAPTDPNQASDVTPIDWVKESNQLAIADAYKGMKQKGKVTEAYARNYVDICRHQIVLGGMRLANILDKALN